MGIIYCLTSPSGKMYIGQTKKTLNNINPENRKYRSKYFTSSLLSDDEKLNLAKQYLANIIKEDSSTTKR